MGSWTVLSRDDAGAPAGEAAERVVFVREKFSWATLLFAPLVLLYHRLWLAFLAFVAVSALMQACVIFFDLPDATGFVVVAGFQLLLAFELPALRLRKLARLGYSEEGVVVAQNREEAEYRFFSGWSAPRPAPAAAPRAPASFPGTPPAVSGVIGSMGS